MTPARFVRFNVVGAFGVVVQLVAMWVLVNALKVNSLVATPLAVGAALVLNFIGHWHWTWRDRRPDIPPGAIPTRRRRGSAALRMFAAFVLANGAVSVFGNLVVMAALVEGAGLRPVAANALAIAICGLVNFALGDLVVFRRHQREPESPYVEADLQVGRSDPDRTADLKVRPYVRARVTRRAPSATYAMAAAKNPTNHA